MQNEYSVIEVLNSEPPRTSQAQLGQKLRTFLSILALGVVGGLFGYGIGSLAKGDSSGTEPSINEFFIIVISVLFLGWLVLLIHEVGHLIGGRIAGFRFMLLVVGPLKVLREGNDIRLRLNTSLALAGGIAASAPMDAYNLRRRMITMVAGGPAASLLLAIMCSGSFLVLLAVTPTPINERVALLLPMAGLMSFAVFLITIIPARTSGFFTDGARLRMLLRAGSQAERWSALVAIYAASLGGQRPRDWSVELIQQATDLPDGTLDDASGYLLAYYWALDQQEYEKAERYLAYALGFRATLPALIRASLALEAAYLAAHYHRNPQAARAWLQQAKGGINDRHTRLRAQAAIAWAAGEHAAVQGYITQALTALDSTIDLGAAEAEREWLHELETLS